MKEFENEIIETIMHRRAVRRFEKKQLEENTLQQILQAGLYAPSPGDPTLKNAFYDAPTVITFFAPKGFLFAAEDCAVAAENMMLAADSLGVGSCYIGQGWTAFDDDYGQDILRRRKIRTDYYAVMQLLLGYPCESDKLPTPKPRKEGRIVRI